MGSNEVGEIRDDRHERRSFCPGRTTHSVWTLAVGSWELTMVIVAGVLAVCAATARAQHYEHPLPADFDEPIRLYSTGLGTFTRPISSSNAEAQKYFNQGFQLMYAFAKAEAGRS